MVHKAWLFYNYPWFIHVLAPLSLSLVLHTTDWEKSGTLTDILVEIVVLCGGTDMEGGAADGDGGALVMERWERLWFCFSSGACGGMLPLRG
jgi:hypothetical protein